MVLYLAPDGDDPAPGTLDAPMKMIEAAAARTSAAKSVTLAFMPSIWTAPAQT